MAKVENELPVHLMHGKPQKKSKGYYYVTPDGKQKYRTRKENYQQKRSPKQKWHTAAFVFAHQQMAQLWLDETARLQIEAEWKQAMHYTPDGHYYPEPKGWRFAILVQQWKNEHPYEQWYEDYLRIISDTAEKKTASESTSDYMLRRQIDILTAQLEELRARLNQNG
ncbi:MAG: hypothetical protein IJ621_00875 [Paludibacteraceae bacterium]|nr:hypothetical protein [Paludibacteraceae bacterium]